VLYVPQGTFEINQSLQVDNVTIQGAGPWYTVLHSNNPFQNGGAQGNIHLKNFAVFGEITERNDGSPDNAFHGVLGANSSVTGLWIQHMKCGLWLMNGASSHLTISDNRILDTTADGINFDGNVTDSVISNNFLRSNGDDGLALWSNGAPDARNTISNNTVVQPQLANGIAIYGGTDETVTGNLVRDTNALGGGILVANRFNATPLSGTITVSHNTTVRAGALDPNWQFGVGAFWVDARDSSPNASIRVTDFRAVASPYEAFQFIDGNGAGKSITNVSVDGASVEGVGTFVVQSQTGGSVSLSNITAGGVGVVGTYNCPYPSSNQPMSFTGSGNSGWTGTWADCSTWPAPGSGPGTPPVGGNLALHRAVSESSHTDVYGAGNAVDGNANTYWESVNNAFPQWITVDLGSAVAVNKVTMKLPPSSAWGARTETATILGSTNGSSYSTLAGSHGYTFDPATGNKADATFTAATVRYVRVQITGNTGWPAGQLSELEVYGP
jgi:F5/8 type C domain-containing protein/alpha-1,3-glucanase-like protein